MPTRLKVALIVSIVQMITRSPCLSPSSHSLHAKELLSRERGLMPHSLLGRVRVKSRRQWHGELCINDVCYLTVKTICSLLKPTVCLGVISLMANSHSSLLILLSSCYVHE